MAEAFGHAATHAPQPMHAAASIALSAISLDMSIALASCAEPVRAEMKPPACWISSRASRETMRSFLIGNGPARHGSTTIVSPSLNLRMCSWQTVVFISGPWGLPLMTIEHMPQMPSRQSWSNAIVSLPCATSCSFRMSNISRKELSGLTLSTVWVTNLPFSPAFF